MRTYLVYLEWPEKCFRVDAKALKFLRTLVPNGSGIVRAKDDASFLRALPKATHVITWHFRREWFARARNLKVLATPGAGRELVSTEAPRGVKLHFGHFHGAIMAESVAGFMLAWARGFFRPEAKMAWGRAALSDRCRIVAGSSAVIIGYGRVGRAIGRKLSALGVEVFGYSRHLGTRPAVLNAKLRKADWLVLSVPGDTGSDNLLDAKMLAKLPAKCVVINVGRGNAVDEDALVDALSGGRLAGAYLDVVKGEAYGADECVPPLKRRGDLPWNLIVMPHASAFDGNYVLAAFRELADDGCL